MLQGRQLQVGGSVGGRKASGATLIGCRLLMEAGLPLLQVEG